MIKGDALIGDSTSEISHLRNERYYCSRGVSHVKEDVVTPQLEEMQTEQTT